MASVFQSIEAAIPPIHREGHKFIAIAIAATLVLGWLWSPLFWIGLVITIWIALFFRDPDRVTRGCSIRSQRYARSHVKWGRTFVSRSSPPLTVSSND